MTEMEKLTRLLMHNNVPFEIGTNHFNNSPQIWIPNKEDPNNVDVICHELSYGGKDGLLEAWSRTWDDARGWLTAESAYELIVGAEVKEPHEIIITDDKARKSADGWCFGIDELDYLLEEHDGETFVLDNGYLYETEE